MAKKIKPSEWDSYRAAREYGKAHGYYGWHGGWIYREGAEPVIRHTREVFPDGSRGTNFKRSLFNGRPICQGWDNFYRKYQREIHAWVKRIDEQGGAK